MCMMLTQKENTEHILSGQRGCENIFWGTQSTGR